MKYDHTIFNYFLSQNVLLSLNYKWCSGVFFRTNNFAVHALKAILWRSLLLLFYYLRIIKTYTAILYSL